MPYLQSAVIKAVAYNEAAQRLRATYRSNGEVVEFMDVPLEVYDCLIFADSVAAFLRNHVEGRYPARKL
jgi:hypothetical protein